MIQKGIPKCDQWHTDHTKISSWIYWISGGRTERRAFLVSLLLAGHLQLGPQKLAGQFGAIPGHKSYWWCNIQVHPITSRYESPYIQFEKKTVFGCSWSCYLSWFPNCIPASRGLLRPGLSPTCHRQISSCRSFMALGLPRGKIIKHQTAQYWNLSSLSWALFQIFDYVITGYLSVKRDEITHLLVAGAHHCVVNPRIDPQCLMLCAQFW